MLIRKIKKESSEVKAFVFSYKFGIQEKKVMLRYFAERRVSSNRYDRYVKLYQNGNISHQENVDIL